MMMRKLLATTTCARRFPPPYGLIAAPDRKSFSSAPSKRPPPASKQPKQSEPQIPDPPPIVSAPTLTEAAAPQKSSSVGVIVGLAIVAAAGGLTWLTWEGKLPLKVNLPQNPWKQTIPDVGEDALGKGRQEEGRDGDRILLESQQDGAEGRRGISQSEHEAQFAKDHQVGSGDADNSVSELGEDEPKKVLTSGLDEILKLLEEEVKPAAGETHTDNGVEDESCSPDSTTLQDSFEVQRGEAPHKSPPSVVPEGVPEEFSQDETDLSLGSHIDSGKGLSATKGDTYGKNAAHSLGTGLPDGVVVHLPKDQADRGGEDVLERDGTEAHPGVVVNGGVVENEDVLERDGTEAHPGVVVNGGVVENDDSEKITEPNVASLKETGESIHAAVGEANKERSPTTVPGGFSDDFLLLRAHEDNLKTFQGKWDGNTAASTTNQQSREPSPLVEPDFLVGAIHTAVQKQAETDAREFNTTLEKLREEHAADLKDSIAKELMYAEEADRLQKELEEEQRKAEERVRLLQQIADEKLKSELKRKEEEAQKNLEEAYSLAKLQANAVVLEERAAHLEQLKDVKLQVDALKTAFYTRSEEARISHTAHKLSMGAFAFENAIRSGAPVLDEAILLMASAGGPGKDHVLDAALASIPGEVFQEGTKTRAQLHDQFNKLKGPLRELVLIPASGGGVFTHLVARFAANIKVSEQSPYVGSEGIESAIGQVENYLADGKLAEAAEVLEKETAGTKAEELAAEWARQARTRAIMEQALQLIQSHAVAIASSLA